MKSSFRIIIAGGRSFDDFDLLKTKLNLYFSKLDLSDLEIVSGGAKGADSLGESYANINGIKLKRFPADWNKYGQGAGYRRNSEMANYANGLIAFWDGRSKGTLHMINLAKSKGIAVKIVKY
jgi:hypothetical protein